MPISKAEAKRLSKKWEDLCSGKVSFEKPDKKVTFTELEVETAEQMQRSFYKEKWVKLLPGVIEACESLIRKIKRNIE